MKQTLTIKLEKYLQEYLLCRLRGSEISTTNIIGALISPFIELIPADFEYKKYSGPEYITFELPAMINKMPTTDRAVYMSAENQRTFERILKCHFKDIFFSYVDDKIRYQPKIKKCILQFCADYKITYQHVNYEMLKKDYYRKRGKKSCIKMSLNCPLIYI